MGLPNMAASAAYRMQRHLVIISSSSSRCSNCLQPSRDWTLTARCTSPFTSEANAWPWDSLLQERLKLLQRAPSQLFKVRGVSFNNRQEAVQRLVTAEPVVFIKEQSNVFDPQAVAIETLDGQQLGHVAKELTGAFPLQQCFGRVVFVAQEPQSGNWGTTVTCCPSLHGISLECLPAAWAAQTNLQQVVPEWRIDHINRQVSLVGLYPLCEPVQQLREQLQQQQSASELDQQASAAIIGQFAALMQWSENSVARYAAHAQRLQKLMVDERWQLELSAAVDFLAA